ncbi:hypothetical protein QUF72_09085 [Desulfobacterales bacterium HSG2]|nr:hypothetical protein [Desulfobacterales bacterium HSG2]
MTNPSREDGSRAGFRIHSDDRVLKGRICEPGEIVTGLRSDEYKSCSVAKDKTESGLRLKLSLLDKPGDWACPIRLVIRKYLNIREHEGGIYQNVFNQFDKRTVAKALEDISNYRKSVSLELVRDIAALSEEQKAELVSATDEQYASLTDGSDSEITDILAAKKELYNYIINPSSQVEKAHTHFTDCMRKVLSGLESISTTKLCTGE